MTTIFINNLVTLLFVSTMYNITVCINNIVTLQCLSTMQWLCSVYHQCRYLLWINNVVTCCNDTYISYFHCLSVCLSVFPSPKMFKECDHRYSWYAEEMNRTYTWSYTGRKKKLMINFKIINSLGSKQFLYIFFKENYSI